MSAEAPAPLPSGKWTGLPPGSAQRLVLPAGPPEFVRAGLLMYHPMTPRGRFAWQVAWRVASTGLFRLLPRIPAPVLPDSLLRFVPPGGSVAVTRTSLPHRSVALIFDRFGAGLTVAKIAGDDLGRASLAAEAAALARLSGRLPGPLLAPSLLSVEPDFLLMQAVRWRLRHRPWLLPEEVAAAMGRFYASGEQPAHGDFAPWNLMRTEEGWMLFDWEDSGLASMAFADPFHYLVQAHAMLGHPRREELLSGLRGRAWIGRSLHAYAAGAGLRIEDARESFARYLVDSADSLRRDPRRRGALRGVAARERLLADLSTG
jgi:hypothetical protein